MKAPEKAWGEPLLRVGEDHLEKFDRRRMRFKKQMVVLLLASSATFVFSMLASSWVTGKVGDYLRAGAFIAMLIAPYGLLRTSFAEHRMFGLYAGGFVPPIHYKGGWEPFVRWDSVTTLRVRHFPNTETTPLGRTVHFVFRFEDHRKMPHRIRETDLVALFGYTEAECVRLEEEILAIARAHLPPERIAVEEHSTGD